MRIPNSFLKVSTDLIFTTLDLRVLIFGIAVGMIRNRVMDQSLGVFLFWLIGMVCWFLIIFYVKVMLM